MPNAWDRGRGFVDGTCVVGALGVVRRNHVPRTALNQRQANNGYKMQIQC